MPFSSAIAALQRSGPIDYFSRFPGWANGFCRFNSNSGLFLMSSRYPLRANKQAEVSVYRLSGPAQQAEMGAIKKGPSPNGPFLIF
jgi:hypothetical protein